MLGELTAEQPALVHQKCIEKGFLWNKKNTFMYFPKLAVKIPCSALELILWSVLMWYQRKKKGNLAFELLCCSSTSVTSHHWQ